MNGITAIPGALQTATSSIRQSQKTFDQDAAVVAHSNTVESRDVVEALVDSRQQLLYTQAAAKLISASDEMTQSLLDVIA